MKTGYLKQVVLLFSFIVSVSVSAQSIMVRDSLTMVEGSADVLYNNEFGRYKMPYLDDPFPYSVIRMELIGDVRQAQAALSLSLGKQFTVEDRIINKNVILFLVPSSVRSIFLQCGEGCLPLRLFLGLLSSNRVYNCRVEYLAGNSSVPSQDLSFDGGFRKYDLDLHFEMSRKDDTLTFVVGNTEFKMIKIHAGSFIMGSLFESLDAKDEHTLHKVSISKDYYIAQTEVTQGLWKEVMGTNCSKFVGDFNPVDNVSWYSCQLFIKWLNEITGLHFRMPTEAEWEFAARGGNQSNGYLYSGGENINQVGWCLRHWGTCKVMQHQPNELGLYDMSGNVWEFCSDFYDPKYKTEAVIDPKGSESGSTKVSRGGAWYNNEDHCRVTYRNFNHPHQHGNGLGLRLVLDLNE